MEDADIKYLGMPADLFDSVTEMVADRDSGAMGEEYDFAHSIAQKAYEYAVSKRGD
jgi:hypothetical protein